MEMGQYQKAIEDFSEVIKIEPESVVGYRFRGIAKTHAKDYPGAINDLNIFIKSDSSDREAYRARGLCHQNLQDWTGSSEDYEKAFVMGEPDYNLLSPNHTPITGMFYKRIPPILKLISTWVRR